MTGARPIRALLADDEPLAIRGLEIRLERYGDVEIVATATNGREALAAIEEHRPDVAFLDVNMPGLGGFDVLRGHGDRGEDPSCHIVFVTAFDQFALRAFEEAAFDYILKPIDDSRLCDVIERLRDSIRRQAQAHYGERIQALLSTLKGRPAEERPDALLRSINSLESGYPSVLSIRDRGRVAKLVVEDIDWIEAERDYMCIHAGGQNFLMRETMARLEERLNPSLFTRVHRSALVNLSKIQELRHGPNGGLTLVLRGGGTVPVGRSYRRKISAHFAQSQPG